MEVWCREIAEAMDREGTKRKGEKVGKQVRNLSGSMPMYIGRVRPRFLLG